MARKHEHEAWMLLDHALGGKYCGACGEHVGWPLDEDPYDKVVFIQGHRHSEPTCAHPDCPTYLTREQMAELPDADA